MSEALRSLIEQAKRDYTDLKEKLRKKGEYLEQMEETIANISLIEEDLL